MTTAQKLKKAEQELSVWKERKHFLANSERSTFKSEIKRLGKLLEDRDKLYSELHFYQNQNADMVYKNARLVNQNKKLERKIKFLHNFYKEKLDEYS